MVIWQKSDEKIKKDPKSFDLESQKVGPSGIIGFHEIKRIKKVIGWGQSVFQHISQSVSTNL